MKKITLLTLIGNLLFLASCAPKTQKYVYDEGAVYGTIYHFIYSSPDGKDLKDSIELKMNKFGNSLSTFVPTSTISRVNKNDTTVRVDPYFRKCFLKGEEVSKNTDGAFDMTVAPLVNAWGFGFTKKDSISPQLIDSLLKTVGYQKVKLVGDRIVKENPNTMLDASGISKGEAVDMVCDYLASQGCKSYMVEIGGEVRAHGVNAKGETWRIGINKPNDKGLYDDNDLQDVIHLNDKALATSGNYRNYYVKDGKRYAHTIDPHTGYPVQHSLLSSSVLANDCMTADAYATAFMVLGVEKAKKIVENDPNLEAYFIYAGDNNINMVWYSSGFKNLIIK